MVILAAVGEKQNKIIETAFDLASKYNDELQVLHVIPEEEAEEHFESIRTIEEFSDISIDVERERAGELAMSFIDRTHGDEQMETITPVGRIGDPAVSIEQHAEAIEPRFIVIGGRKRSPVGKAVFGSVSQSVILNTRRPVVVVNTDE